MSQKGPNLSQAIGKMGFPATKSPHLHCPDGLETVNFLSI